jgi:DNA-binding MarR family transcriptional regulator
VDDVTDAEPNLGLLLFIPYRFMECAVMNALRAHGHDLPLNQARVFQRISPGGSRLAELAEAAQLPKQTVGSIVDQLEGAGYVRRCADPHDARARLVTITARGRQLVDISLPVVREVEAAWRTHLGPARTRQLKETLMRLREITDLFPQSRTQ